MDATQLLARKGVRDAVKTCVGCGLHKICNAPVPFSGPSRPSLVCVGEAPGAKEDESGEPFVGPSGHLLRAWLAEAGIDVAEVGFVNAVCCFPRRTPTEKEVNACRTNLHAQLRYLDAPRILALGGVAFNSLFYPARLRISYSRSLSWRFEIPGYRALGVATWHPSAVLRNESLATQAKEDVRKAVQLSGEITSNNFCYYDECYHTINLNEYMGVGYCRLHPIEGAK